jgi:hypothetical protein
MTIPVIVTVVPAPPVTAEDGARSACAVCGEPLEYDASFGAHSDALRWSSRAIYMRGHYTNICEAGGSHTPADDVDPVRVEATRVRDRLILAARASREAGTWTPGTDHGQARYEIDRVELEMIARGDWAALAYTYKSLDEMTAEDGAELVERTARYWGVSLQA